MCFIIKLFKRNKIQPGQYSPKPQRKNRKDNTPPNKEHVVLQRVNTLLSN